MRKVLTLLLCFCFFLANGQNEFKVRRGFKIDRRAPIYNIHVDDKGLKWVADEQGLVLVQSANFADPVAPEPDNWSLLTVPDGNYELSIPKATLQKFLGDDLSIISCGLFDESLQELWIGTENDGLFQFKTGTDLQLVKNWTSSNSKLRSNTIQTLELIGPRRLLVGTYDGILNISGDKTSLEGKNFSIEAIAVNNGVTWVVSDGEVLEMDKKGDFYYFETDDYMTEGLVKDIAFDSRERLWIASEIVIRYDFDKENYEVYGPIQEFTSQNVNCIAVDFDDALWVGTQDKGLYFIGKSSTLIAEIVLTTPLDCEPNAKNAALQVRASGGKPPYSYKWNGGLSGENPSNIGAGTYKVIVTDQDKNTVEAETVIEDAQFSVSVQQVKPASLGGSSDGQAKLTITPDSRAFKIQWDNGEDTRVAQKLSVGEHSVSITGNKGCTSVATIEITEELAPLSVNVEILKGIDCPGNATASLRAQASGGQAPYSYTWNPAGSSGEEASNLGAGTYTVQVQDATGASANATMEIKAPTALEASATARSAASTNNADGKAKVSAKGGNAPYTYQWDTGETTETAQQLAAGAHSVTVTDATGCTTTTSVEISENILALSVSLEEVSVIKCSGGSDAALEASVTGGKAPFQYQWSTDKGQDTKAANLAAGEYGLTVTDAAGNNADAKISINQPSPITATTTVRAPASTNNADGKAKVNVKGGTAPYTYKWDTGESTETAEKLAAGAHTVSITDAAGCSTTASVDITENILELTVALEETSPIKCADGSYAVVEASIAGGKSPYQYQWSTDKGQETKASNLAVGEYGLTVTDVAGNTATAKINLNQPSPITATTTVRAPASTNNADGKARVNAKGGTGKYTYNWDSGETTQVAEKLAAGTHTVTITDEAGCTATTEVEITENILELTVALEEEASIKCAGENSAVLRVEANGGKPPFQYQWNTDKGNGEKATGLGVGEYSLSLTDAAGTTKTVSAKIAEPAPVEVQTRQTAPASTNNSDGQALATAKGGTGNFSFSWDNGATTANASNLSPGMHSLTVTDQNGCTATASIDITENILPLTVRIEQTADIKCNGEKTASLEVKVEGGKPPFQYAWNTTELSGQTGSNLGPGEYQVSITDAAGTNQSANISIQEPTALTLDIGKPGRATNEDSKDGKATLAVNGGTPDYTVSWDNGEAGLKAEKLPVGQHSVSVKDANGCTAEISFEVKKKILPALTAGRLSAGQTLQVSQIYFDADSTNMNPGSFPVVNEIADFLEENPLIVIEVGGHTNNIPPHEFCDQLSTARAKSVASYIVQKGVDPTRVVYKGYGKREPRFSNRTEDGRRRNQRVEIKILRLN